MRGQTPEQLIFDAVRDAGVDGVGIVDLSKLVRSTFKSFKVRDHGFAQMRQYIASLADIKVVEAGQRLFRRARRDRLAPYAVAASSGASCASIRLSPPFGAITGQSTLSPAVGFAMIATRKCA